MFDRLIITAIHPSLTAEHYRERLWQRPEHGLLRGKIVEVIDNTHFRLHDPRGRHWTIQYSSGAMRQEAMISSGMFIHLKGTMELHDHFSAEHIRTEQRRMFREQRKSRKSL
jgi:hypothetical protein